MCVCMSVRSPYTGGGFVKPKEPRTHMHTHILVLFLQIRRVLHKAGRGLEGLCKAPLQIGLYTYIHKCTFQCFFPTDSGVLQKTINRGLCKACRGFMKPLYRAGFVHKYIHTFQSS